MLLNKERRKNKHTCLNTSCLEHSWICLKHTDENRPLIEAHYNEFNIWDQQIPAQISKTHMANKLDHRPGASLRRRGRSSTGIRLAL